MTREVLAKAEKITHTIHNFQRDLSRVEDGRAVGEFFGSWMGREQAGIVYGDAINMFQTTLIAIIKTKISALEQELAAL